MQNGHDVLWVTINIFQMFNKLIQKIYLIVGYSQMEK